MKRIIIYLFILTLFTGSCNRLKKRVLANCYDKVQNQNETDVDCGGVCDPCPSCFDYKKNQNEDSVDCGGVCKPCPTCSDGIINQGEENVDCGGPCIPCPTCEDGIMNQDESGIDCGGVCEPCTTNACSTAVGYGDNAYVLNGHSAFVGTSSYISSDSEVEVTLSFPESGTCSQYLITFYENNLFDLPINGSRVYTVDYGSNHPANKCNVSFYLKFEVWNASPNSKVYIKRIGQKEFNLKFCHLNSSTTSTIYTFNTTFSANANFILN